MRLLIVGLLGCLFASPHANAQTPPLANAPVSGSDFLRPDFLGSDGLRSGGPEPDTTAPQRYFPLAVGNAWEYYYYSTGDRRRAEVTRTEVVNGQDYFRLRSRTYDPDGKVIDLFGRPVRFDTTEAVVQVYVYELSDERPYRYGNCPLDAAFGDEAFCLLAGGPMEVGGDYDGLLAFGEPFPGTGQDTVRTAVKTYPLQGASWLYDARYAADIGFVYLNENDFAHGIYYARVGGVEHGVPVLPAFPVEAEEGAAEPETLRVEAWPNPSRGAVRIALTLDRPQPVALLVVDPLGRVVARRDLGVLSSGHHEVALDGSAWGAGLYLVRVEAGAQRATERITLVR